MFCLLSRRTFYILYLCSKNYFQQFGICEYINAWNFSKWSIWNSQRIGSGIIKRGCRNGKSNFLAYFFSIAALLNSSSFTNKIMSDYFIHLSEKKISFINNHLSQSVFFSYQFWIVCYCNMYHSIQELYVCRMFTKGT